MEINNTNSMERLKIKMENPSLGEFKNLARQYKDSENKEFDLQVDKNKIEEFLKETLGSSIIVSTTEGHPDNRIKFFGMTYYIDSE